MLEWGEGGDILCEVELQPHMEASSSYHGNCWEFFTWAFSFHVSQWLLIRLLRVSHKSLGVFVSEVGNEEKKRTEQITNKEQSRNKNRGTKNKSLEKKHRKK